MTRRGIRSMTRGRTTREQQRADRLPRYIPCPVGCEMNDGQARPSSDMPERHSKQSRAGMAKKMCVLCTVGACVRSLRGVGRGGGGAAERSFSSLLNYLWSVESRKKMPALLPAARIIVPPFVSLSPRDAPLLLHRLDVERRKRRRVECWDLG